ncbi:MAG: DsbC family protein [Marinobacter sp.]|nr:DsbC family protein [Marinobacter sp.]
MKIQSMWARLLVTLVLMCGAIQATAEDRSAAIREQLAAKLPGLKIASVQASAAPGLYEVQAKNGDTVYATEDGQFLLTGDLLQLNASGLTNVTEARRAEQRAQALADFGDKSAIIFPAKGKQKAEISVFTDIDCPYCRKLHSEVGQLNDMGITVKYYAFPRSGPNTPSFSKYVSVWCSDDQQKALTEAKQGVRVAAKSCDNPVRAQFELGNRIGVTGTPAIVLEDGNMIRGYVPADKLAQGLGLM